MKYMGSKSRIAKDIVLIIQGYIDKGDTDVYVEPFVGGANVIDKIECDIRIGVDCNPYLIELFRYVQRGGMLPNKISREEYVNVREHKEQYEPWLVGCVGYLASYNGKFFGGYSGRVLTKIGMVRDYYDESKRNLLRQAKKIKSVEFIKDDYRNLKCNGCVIYCDPPYAGTTGYVDSFDNEEFWNVVREWSKNNIVLVSEQVAPPDFKVVWQKDIVRTQDNQSRKIITEKLFIKE